MILGQVLLRFLDVASANPRWLHTGEGPRYHPEVGAADGAASPRES